MFCMFPYSNTAEMPPEKVIKFCTDLNFAKCLLKRKQLDKKSRGDYYKTRTRCAAEAKGRLTELKPQNC